MRNREEFAMEHPCPHCGAPLPEDASLEDVCKLLSEAGVKKVPVVSGGKIVGIVSRSAVTQYLAKRYLSQGQAGVSA